MTLEQILPEVEGADSNTLAAILGPGSLSMEVDNELLDTVRQAIKDLRKWSDDVEKGVLTGNEQQALALESIAQPLKKALETRQGSMEVQGVSNSEDAPDEKTTRLLENLSRAILKSLTAF
jgi:hypothetical protein